MDTYRRRGLFIEDRGSKHSSPFRWNNLSFFVVSGCQLPSRFFVSIFNFKAINSPKYDNSGKPTKVVVIKPKKLHGAVECLFFWHCQTNVAKYLMLQHVFSTSLAAASAILLNSWLRRRATVRTRILRLQSRPQKRVRGKSFFSSKFFLA